MLRNQAEERAYPDHQPERIVTDFPDNRNHQRRIPRPDAVADERIGRRRQRVDRNQHHHVNTSDDIRDRQLALPQMLHGDKEHEPRDNREEILQHHENGDIQHPPQQGEIERAKLIQRVFAYIHRPPCIYDKEENRHRLGDNGSNRRPLDAHPRETRMSENQ